MVEEADVMAAYGILPNFNDELVLEFEVAPVTSELRLHANTNLTASGHLL